MARRRKNATFTLDQTYGSGHGDRSLIQAFYRKLNELYPGSTPVPIPPESQIHPQHDAKTQAFIFADYAVRKIAPIALRAVALTQQAAALERLDPITNEKTAARAVVAARPAADAANTTFAAIRDAAADYATTFAASMAAVRAERAVRDAAAAADYATAELVIVARRAGIAVAAVAELNPDATWAAVNEMLQAL